MIAADVREFLDFKHNQYNRPEFIESDPISIPHRFKVKEDVEIAAFLAATIAWGQRPVIIRNANLLMTYMEEAPYQFIINASTKELNGLKGFKHRTFNGVDCIYFMKALKHIYLHHGGLENIFSIAASDDVARQAILNFRKVFFSITHPQRTQKHISNPGDNSAAKRLNMFLRWMVRKDTCGVDFGIWKTIKPAQLMCPLDVHSGNVARKLGLLTRKQNDWKAVEELTVNLRLLDVTDPVKYDIALFGLGVFEGF